MVAMRLEHEEIETLAGLLAPRIATLLAARLEARPEWAFSIREAASWAQVEPHVIRRAIADGKLPCVRIGRSIRIRRSDLFGIASDGRPDPADGEDGSPSGHTATREG